MEEPCLLMAPSLLGLPTFLHATLGLSRTQLPGKICSQIHLFFTKLPHPPLPPLKKKDAVKVHFLEFMVDFLCLPLLPNLNTQQ